MANAEIYRPSLIITSSRRPSRLTNTFMKALSSIFDAPVVRRGSSNLDQIAYIARENNFRGFIVIFTRKGNPSVINFYHEKEGYYSLAMRIFLIGIYINRNFKGNFGYLKSSLIGKSTGAKKTFNALKDYFKSINSPDENRGFDKKRIVDLYVDDLSIINVGKYKRYSKDSKFEPSEIHFVGGGEKLLMLRVHHTLTMT